MSDRSEPGRWVRAMLEFMVIVVGVLVALALDQWSSDRDDRVNEIAYLSALATDLSVDSTIYEDLLIPEATRARSALASISPVARGVASVPSDTNAFFRLVTTSTFNVTQFGTRRATFDELLATGNLRLIESATLRSSVVSYYETVSLTDNRSAARASGYPGIVRGYLPFTTDQAPDTALAALGEHPMRMFESEQFVTTLHGHIFWVDFQLDLLEDLLSEVTAVTRDVDAELERLR